MFGNSSFDRVRQVFADQFSQDTHGFIYRKGQKGPAIRVSEDERDRFVATFNSRIRYAAWSIFPATVALIFVLVWLIPDSDSPAANRAIWAGTAMILAAFMAIFYWAWGAPSRELHNRAPEVAALTKDEARALAFSKITYGQLALGPLMGLGLIWKMSAKTDVLHGWGLIWLALGGGLIAICGVQAIRKWRFDRP